MRTTRYSFLLAVLLVLTVVTPAASHDYAPYTHTNFTANCGHSYHWLQYGRDRSGARSYSAHIRWEGYQWGGGCYNYNNVDDQPGDPVQQVSTNGEGPDCSGLVFRSWGMSKSWGSLAQYNYPAGSYQHGPYSAQSFRDGASSAITQLSSKSYSATIYSDVLASSSHVGMIYYEGNSNNTDTIIESKSESAGSGLWSRSYRGQSSYKAARYDGW